MLDKKFDFLAPFLQFVQDPSNITKVRATTCSWHAGRRSIVCVCVFVWQEEAKRADHECRKAMRARLVERVNIIQRRLDEENEKLQKKQVSVVAIARVTAGLFASLWLVFLPFAARVPAQPRSSRGRGRGIREVLRRSYVPHRHPGATPPKTCALEFATIGPDCVRTTLLWRNCFIYRRKPSCPSTLSWRGS